MNRISSFIIKKLRIEGFKRFIEPVEFDFGSMTYITGHNAQGKSSIADAITYAITGVPYFGAEKNLDRLYSIGTKDIKVVLTIEVDGAEHMLVRERTNDVTTITYDGVLATQTDLIEMFGERDLFLSIFNPLYFIEELGDKGRNLLARYLPAVSREEVIARLSEPNRKLIEAANMASPEGMLTRLKEDIKELKDNIIYYEGQRDLLANQVMDRAERLKEMQTQTEGTENQLSVLWKKRVDGLNFEAMETQRSDLYKTLDELSRSTDISNTAVVDAEIMQLRQKLEQRRLDEYNSKYTQALAEVQTKLNQKIASFRQAEGTYNALCPGIQCPTCKQTITEANIAEVKSAFAKSGTEISDEGKELTAQLNELKELDRKARNIFEEFKATDIFEMEKLIEQAVAKKDSLPAEGASGSRQTEMAAIKAQIQSLDMTIENGNLNDTEAAEYTALLKKHEQQYHAVKAFEAQSQAAPEEKEQDIERMQESLNEKKTLETAVKFYIAERMAILFEGFDMLKKVNIQLYEIVKTTGEAKDVFRFTYEDRPYKFLSYSEKIKAGLELSELLKKLTNSSYPVFVDNGESVPVIDNIVPTGQVLISQVVKGAPLKVSAADASAKQAA